MEEQNVIVAKTPESGMPHSSENERNYVAFITYRHKPLDKEAAERIQKKIENYIVPKEFRKQAGGKKLGMVFRDEDELPASSTLTDSIYYALDHSRFLIVICTPDLPKSKWCEKEIRYFLETHDRDHILAVVTDGHSKESFSPYMLHTYDKDGNITGDTEPLAANIVGKNHTIDKKAFKKEIVRLFAALIGCPFDALWQRERRAQTNRLLKLAGLALAVMAVFLGVVLNRNSRISEQNALILEQNEKIEDQNTRLQTQLSSVLVDSGINKLENFDVNGALKDALSAVENEDPAVYDHRALKLMEDAMGAYCYDEMRVEVVYEQSMDITQLEASDDETRLLLKDRAGVIRCLDTETYEELWEIRTDDPLTFLYTADLGDKLIYKSIRGVYCHDLEDGSLLWSYEHKNEEQNNFRVLSEDGSLFAVAEQGGRDVYGEAPVTLIILRTEDGKELGRVELSREGFGINLDRLVKYYELTGAFAPDNSAFVCCLPSQKTEAEKQYCDMYFFVDLNTFEVRLLGSMIDHEYEYGLDIDPGDHSVFLAGYNGSLGGIHTGLFSWDGDRLKFSEMITDHAFSRPGVGIIKFNDLEDNETTFLSRNDMAYVFSDNTLAVFKRSENHLVRSFSLSGKIVNARWLDKEEGLMEIATSDGYILNYYTEGFDEWVFSKISGSTIGAEIKKARGIGGSLFYGNGYSLMVPAKAPERLLKVSSQRDPNSAVFDFRGNGIEYSNEVKIETGSRTGFLICNGNDAITFDKETGEIQAAASFEDSLGWGIYPLNDTRFVYRDKVYNMDGTSEDFGEPVCLELFPFRPHDHTYLTDKRLLSWIQMRLYTLSQEYSDDLQSGDTLCMLPVWIDGKVVAFSADRETGLFYCDQQGMDDDPLIDAGANGLVMAYARRAEISDGHLVIQPEKEFQLMDVQSGKVTVLANAHPSSGGFSTAFAHIKKIMAVVYDDGKICFYDAGTGTSETLDLCYSQNEIFTAGYDKEDRYFMVLTSAGQLDIYDAGTLERLFSDSPAVLKNWSSEHVNTAFSINRLEAVDTVNGTYLCVTAGNDSCSHVIMIDLASRTIVAEVASDFGGFCAYDTETDRIFTGIRDGKMISYPVYDLKALKEWAAKRLAARSGIG